MIEQCRQHAAQETEKLRAEIHADQERRVATIQAETVKQVAEIDKQTAFIRADKVRKAVEGQKLKDGHMRSYPISLGRRQHIGEN